MTLDETLNTKFQSLKRRAIKLSRHMRPAQLFLAKKRFGRVERQKFYKKTATLLAHNLKLRDVLARFSERETARKNVLAVVYNDIYARYAVGSLPFDQACLPWIPKEEVMLIGAGLKSGLLPDVLMDCVRLLEAQGKIGRSLVDGVSYPIFIFCFMLGALLFIALTVMPTLTTISNPKTWTGSAWSLYRVSTILASPMGIVVFALMLGCVVGIFATMPYWTGKYRLWVEKVPPWSMYRLMVGTTWLFTLATLLRGGIQMENVFASMLRGQNLTPWLAERVRAIRVKYRNESNLGKILVSIGMHFPDDEIARDLADYMSVSDFHANLYDIANEWLEESVLAMKRAASVLNIMAMSGLGGMVMWVLTAIYSIMFQLSSGIGGGF